MVFRNFRFFFVRRKVRWFAERSFSTQLENTVDVSARLNCEKYAPRSFLFPSFFPSKSLQPTLPVLAIAPYSPKTASHKPFRVPVTLLYSPLQFPHLSTHEPTSPFLPAQRTRSHSTSNPQRYLLSPSFQSRVLPAE